MNKLPAVALALILLAGASVRLRLADVPLERDEGEYAYAGQLILQGVPPYAQVYNMKFPGTYYAYAAIMVVFGETPRGIRHGLLLWNALTTIVLFLLARKFLEPWPAVAACAVFVALTLDRAVLGPFGHATHFLILPALAGFLVLLRRTSSAVVLAGVLLGIAVIMKQHAIFFAAAAAYLVWRRARSAGFQPASSHAGRMPALHGVLQTGLLALGGAIPFAVMIAVLAAQDVLGRFWFWTIDYASEYATEIALSRAWTIFAFMFKDITQHALLMWIAAGAGLVALWAVRRWPRDTRLFLTTLAVASFLAVCPGFFFRNHYFIVMLPAVALLAGVLFESVDHALRRKFEPATATAAAMTVCAVILLAYVDAESRFLFSMTPRDLSRAAYQANPFVEAPEIARYIAERTTPSDRIAVLGSEPEIFFYANRKSATGYIYTYPLMEEQAHATEMQNAMRREIEQAAPKYMVLVWVQGSWYVQASSNRAILTWAEEYAKKCYDVVGLGDIHSPERTEMLWEKQMLGYQPRSPNLLYVLRRKPGACAQGASSAAGS